MYFPPGARAALHATFSLEGFSRSNRIEDEVVNLAWGVLLRIINHCVRSEGRYQIQIRGAAHSGHDCPKVLGKLDRRRPYRAGGSVDKYLLPSSNGAFPEVVQGEEASVGNSRRFLVGQVGWS